MNDDRPGTQPPRPGSTRRERRPDTRNVLLGAAAGLLQEKRRLTMRGIATRAGVGRSTLYRHFDTVTDVQRLLQQRALTEAAAAIERSLSDQRPPLAELRSVVTGLVQVGSQWPIDTPLGPPADAAITETARPLASLAGRLANAAELTPPSGSWLATAVAAFVEACLRVGWSSPVDVETTAERLLRIVTDPLDRGLLVLDADGAIVALNDQACVALGGDDALGPGQPAVVHRGGRYEDGSPASAAAHPLSVALATRAAQEGVRGVGAIDGEVRWYTIDVRPLTRAGVGEPYGFIAVFCDVTDQKRSELAQLRPAGQLRARTVPLLDIVRALDEISPALLPDQLVAEAMRVTGGPVALYVLDIDGSHLLRLAGRDDFPERLLAPLALGPELAEDGVPGLAAHLDETLPGVAMAPMWLRGRAVGVLLALRDAQVGLGEIARLGAAALELGNGYTDVVDAARRRKDMDPAAEVQQSLIPPRIARIGGGEIAGSVLPSYDVGGDWFDYVENRDGAWMAIADAAGRGPEAGGRGSVALAALRAARRNGATLEQATQTVHETMCDVGGPEFFLTGIIARWQSVYASFSWINCGHPPPLLLRADDTFEELTTRPDLPLGVFDRARAFHRHQRRLRHGDRMILYSDGVARRRTAHGLFGTTGIARAAVTAGGRSATATARAIQEAVTSASEDPLPDDAAVVVLTVDAPG